MDLSTMRKKLDLSEYFSASEFEQDFRLMLSNCFTFNTAGTEIYNYGKQLESLFDLKWTEKASFLAQHSDNNRKEDSDDDGTLN